ncbi:MAG: hypothetical protein A2566_02145 [Candidatus Zambryskibacteria bacterium RIFOXYD1_FULL_40_13]|nr:MAG: Glycosyltransferase [Parcubacteria group bacterium GW2011_GWD2_35_7]KKQ99236.1 MAG: Glycosyltransferase [Parcubacteria group bacterium GW2011_GWC1_39_12]KKR18943.1 MAG: Glycosyltransferase [Parcubacteria group bacterium GW2011_GWF1_39_37]KKR35580.1 MAG: Glycosyltransferase [Parcubacteria group bacterium GW2011_GWC2_40_10]KKR51991.1 MAG: Glycosyltransferase [Parcubacteria group bacterium GW2011_GWE1_40_20]KKR66340.1 MAG: Glycosyltransferase [Parcubacteria group bacterium GW2011_GWB1_40_
MDSNLNILITTGIYPPKIGGPAQYAKNLKITLENMGNSVSVKTFSVEDYLPTGIRHIFFFFKIIPRVIKSDVVIILDTFSAGLPTVLACKLFGKKSIVRTGGDFLWEQYVERTGKKVLLRNFYKDERHNFSKKENIILSLSKWTLLNTSAVVFSTEWQRDIFMDVYNLQKQKIYIVENYYGVKETGLLPQGKIFIASTRNLRWKNINMLKRVFDKVRLQHPEAILFLDNVSFPDFMNKIKNCYAVLQVSLGDISPNLILDAIRYGKPFICTKEVGILPRISDAGIFVDPLNEAEVERAILTLLGEAEYRKAKEKVENFSFVHTWNDIAHEFIQITNFLKK